VRGLGFERGLSQPTLIFQNTQGCRDCCFEEAIAASADLAWASFPSESVSGGSGGCSQAAGRLSRRAAQPWQAGEPSSCIWSETNWEGSVAREASRDSASHNISLMRTGPAGLLDELAAVLGLAMMIGHPSRRIARGRYTA